MIKKVVVLGGGVAGMSAAHELIERDFEVAVYEKLRIPGGKARSVEVSQPIPPPWNSASAVSENGKPLPGEHGFRFFAGFYNHLPDTMRRIPFKNNRNGVIDNLVPVEEIGFTRFGKDPIFVKAQVPWSLKGLIKQFEELFGSDIGIPGEEIKFFAERIWQLMTSCEERRLAEYEQLAWWEFLEADSKSEPFRKLLVLSVTRTLVAAQANVASTYTIGNIFLQLLFDALDPTIDLDKLLSGATNQVWLNPWLQYLKNSGVDYHLNAEVVAINCADGQISSAAIKEDGKTFDVQGDYFLSALPIEAMAPLITDDLLKIDPTLTGIKQLAPNVAWMNGLQIFLKRDVKIGRGHLNHTDSKWALTSVSQRQFWSEFPDYAGGEVQGIISVDISDWNSEGLNGKTAVASTRGEIFKEVWKEIKMSMIENGEEVLKDEDVHSWHLDPDIVFENGPDDPDPTKKKNTEPLLVNLINTRGLRPEAYTRIPNLFLASDYVRSNTDLATMEAANEAARRAVNCVLDTSGSKKHHCKIWKLHEPALLGFWRENDLIRFAKGLPWKEKLSWSIFLKPRFWYYLIKFILIRIRIWIRKKRLGL